jgi:hypothetical protein
MSVTEAAASGCTPAVSVIAGEATCTVCGGAGLSGGAGSMDGANATAAAVIVATPVVKHERSEISM